MGSYDLQFILFFLVLPATLILAASFLSWLSVSRSRALAKVLGTSDEGKARKNLKNTGLVIMAVPWAIMLAFNIIFVIASVPIGGMLLIIIIPLLAVFLITLSHPLLGSSLAIGVFALLAVPSIGLIAFHYEISAWYGGLLLLFDIVWLIGALTIIKSLPRRPKNLPYTNGREAG